MRAGGDALEAMFGVFVCVLARVGARGRDVHTRKCADIVPVCYAWVMLDLTPHNAHTHGRMPAPAPTRRARRRLRGRR